MYFDRRISYVVVIAETIEHVSLDILFCHAILLAKVQFSKSNARRAVQIEHSM